MFQQLKMDFVVSSKQIREKNNLVRKKNTASFHYNRQKKSEFEKKIFLKSISSTAARTN